MDVQEWHIEQIKPYETNPRVITAKAVAKVAASIERFGWRQPIVVDADGIVIVGHTRLKAAKELGLERVPVHVASGLDDEEIKAYRIADNKVGEESSWDLPLLTAEIEGLDGIDLELNLLGFDEDELFNLTLDPVDPVDTGPQENVTIVGERLEDEQPTVPQMAQPMQEGITFTVRLTTDQNETVMSAIQHLRNIGSADSVADALVYMAENHT